MYLMFSLASTLEKLKWVFLSFIAIWKINVDLVHLIMFSGPASLLFIANYWIDKSNIKVIFLTTDVL